MLGHFTAEHGVVLAEHPHDVASGLALGGPNGAKQFGQGRQAFGALERCDVPGQGQLRIALFLAGLEAALDEDREQPGRLEPEGVRIAPQLAPEP